MRNADGQVRSTQGSLCAVRRRRQNNDVKTTTFKLSDLLGFMWRRGLLDRYPAPSQSTGSLARFAYSLKNLEPAAVAPIPFSLLSPLAAAREKRFGSSEVSEASKPSFSVRETADGVELEFEQFTVVIKSKN